MCDLITALTIGSTVMGGLGQIQQGQATAASARYNAQVSDMNAKLADKAAKDALERGAVEEQKQRQKTAQVIGAQTAGMAANGVDISFGSPLDLLVDTATMGELDALTIRANTAREERDIRQQGENYRGQAGMYRASASSAETGGFLGAMGTVLGGGANAYKSYKTSNIGAY